MNLAAIAAERPVTGLVGALPETDPDIATALRIVLDARFCPTVGRWTGLATRPLGLGRQSHTGLLLALTSVAGEFSVTLDADASPTLATLHAIACEVQGEAIAAALASGWLQEFTQGMRARALELRVLRVMPVERSPAAPEPMPAVALGAFEAHVVAMDAAFGLFASEEMALSASPARDARIPRITLTPSIVLASRDIPAALLRKAGPGDVFIAGLLPLAVRWRLGLSRGRAANAMIESLSVAATLTTRPLPYEDVMEENDRNIAEPDALDDIEIPVTFEIDAEAIDLATLKDLSPGQIVATRQRLESATVRLRSNGHAIGRGQLVAVGGFLGVRIEQMAWSRDVAHER